MNGASAQTSEPTDIGRGMPGMARALTIGVVAGIALSFFGVAGALLAGGRSLSTAVGLGAFVAIWGGLGFGGMLGGVIWASRAEEAEKRDRGGARQISQRTVDQTTPLAMEPSVGDGGSSPTLTEASS